jgi:hypothetical protein
MRPWVTASTKSRPIHQGRRKQITAIDTLDADATGGKQEA